MPTETQESKERTGGNFNRAEQSGTLLNNLREINF